MIPEKSEHDMNTTLDLLVAIHSFSASMTKDEFLDKIGVETTWHTITNKTGYPDLYALLSYSDDRTRQNFATWLHNKIDYLKDQGYLGGHK